MKIKEPHLNLIVLVVTFSVSIGAFLLGLNNANSKTFGTVDIQTLLSNESRQLAKSFPNGSVSSAVMQQVVEDIKTVIKDFGQDKKIILLAKGAVLSGELPDYTDEIANTSVVTTKTKTQH